MMKLAQGARSRGRPGGADCPRPVPASRRAILAGLAAGVAWRPDRQAAAQDLRDLKFATPSTSLNASGLRISDELGLFRKRGLRPQFIRLDSASVSTAALAAGSVDFAVGGSSDLLAARTGGQPIVAAVNLYKGFSNFVILGNATAARLGVSQDAPVADRIKALDGLLLAGTSATSVGTLALRATTLAGGARVRLAYLLQENMPAALESGAIQGYIAATPTASIPLVRGTGIVWLAGVAGDFPATTSPGTSSLVMVRSDFGKNNPGLIDTLQDILAEFQQLVKDDLGRIKIVVRKLYPDLPGQVIDMFFEKEAVGFDSRPLTADDVRRDIAFLRVTAALPTARLDSLDPEAAVFRKDGATN